MRNFCLILLVLLQYNILLLHYNKCAIASEVKPQPTLSITTLDGKNFNLQENLGKVIIINFWAKWCVDCRKEMIILNEIYNEYKSRNVEIIGINIDKKRQRQKVSEISSTLAYKNAMFIDAKETNFEEPNSIPANYIIDKKGNLVTMPNINNSELKKEDFEKILKQLL